MGLFKSAKDMIGRHQAGQAAAGTAAGGRRATSPAWAGQFQQMGDMLGQAGDQLKELNEQQGGNSGLLADGIAGEGVIIAHGVPARGAQWFNMDIDMEIHVGGKAPYQVNNQYMVPNGATLGPGVRLPVKVDPHGPGQDRDRLGTRLRRRRHAARSAPPAAPRRPPARPPQTPSSGGGDSVAELERLAKLKESGALTDAEFEQQKAKILGS